ncbi:nitrate reductase [Endozoicomonas montiporae]|uniref:nitrate reductase (cytochrome) n=2 Tax=Endozoicomonas montiporae TaxID=1027273 RepID=A0A081N7E6_9GAMM|nr:nitrate reductase [Endozoicomonas montiporae]AMO55790.1 assimilatory nitrate reductase catalytic subunit [Endozoicomonas montiporae CL-33]KEQ14369.1 nitrate reductase [Endozoicomonas montiporae]
MAKTVHTTCAYCGVGCGIKAEVSDQTLHLVNIQGNEDHPANFGRLCSKGSALGETVSLENRLLTPEVDGEVVHWDRALESVASRLRDTVAQYGPDAVALYGSGQLMTEDYYVANKLMKGFIGSANIDTNSRLCMASTVAGHKRAFGSDTLPNCYEDLEQCDLLVLVGSNTAWCHPVLFQRIRAAKQQRPEMKVVVIDPRKTDTCDIADLHLPLRPGTDVALFAGLLMHLSERGVVDGHYVEQHTTGLQGALKAAEESAGSIQKVAEICDLDCQSVEAFYRWFASLDKTVTAWSQGVNQSVAGTDKVNAIINCHLLTGRIGKPGSGPLSLTGQPNAMGGREVGGLASQLAAHMDFSDPADIDRVRRFWQAPAMADKPGKTAVDMFQAVEKGKIKFIWIMGTNPLVSMPDADQCRAALAKCPTVVVSDCIKTTDTSAYADILLPAAGWSEKDGTVTNSERRISRQKALFPLSGDARPDWWIVSQVATCLGFSEAFNYQQASQIFCEHAALSGFENSDSGKRRDFDISALSRLTENDYDQLQPLQWPVSGRGHYTAVGSKRLFAGGGFFTEDRKARFVPTCFSWQRNQPDEDYPLLLNTGRIRDQWHTMTRTALSARLSQHIDEPFIEVHPDDASRLMIKDQSYCRVSSAFGNAVLKVTVTDSCKQGTVFAPMHWSRTNSRSGAIGSLVNPLTDPVSRQPDCKHTPVRLEAFDFNWHGVFLTREKLDMQAFTYGTEVRMQHGFRYELSDDQDLTESLNMSGDRIRYLDPVSGCTRHVLFKQNKLQGILITDCQPVQCDRSWLQSAFARSEWSVTDRWQLLAGNAPQGEGEGQTVCACFGVGERLICRAIAADGITDPAQVGQTLKAGTNCGSCIPEIRRLIKSVHTSSS